ncbi:molecular chaperone [Ferrimonas marina]|uniref:Hypothetical chaperone protein n=1 Tax=Ferrimonas marina TaxID=299255 RepID=A0A1M5YTN1_9GAMM|nr:molecular chaperone [Ferrimonas marina]SHI15421.1 hypothetical chaperone protein [Ferrimonas marina]
MHHKAGLDLGTSNCAIGVVDNGTPSLVELPQHGRFMASTLYAPQAEVIAGWLHRQLKPHGLERPLEQARGPGLTASLHALREAKLDGYDEDLAFGQWARDKYLEDPADCYYIRSHKSFLGGNGLGPRQQQVFEDITAAMLWHLLEQARQSGQGDLKKVVIGRPINFQGHHAERSNQQAVAIIERAAKLVGIEQMELFYEPMAAGLTYQQQLDKPQRVLVVDIGGGTTDVSMLEMGPQLQGDLEKQILGYSGERTGGNDFDVMLNYHTLMPLLGRGLKDDKGRVIPLKPFLDAASINDLSAQTRFYSHDTRNQLQALRRQPELKTLSRLQTLQAEQMTFQQSAVAEQAKIALSQASNHSVALDYLEPALSAQITQAQFVEASEGLMTRITQLIDDTLAQAGSPADVLFLTGGSANSPFIRERLEARYGLPMVDGDNFGSVTTGLALWADRIFQ